MSTVKSPITCILALVCISMLLAAEAAAGAEGVQLPHRKLAQWRDRRRRGYNNVGDQQFARNQAAAINTQQAIRGAAASGANPYATRGATYAGSANAFLAAQRSDLVYAPGVVLPGRKL